MLDYAAYLALAVREAKAPGAVAYAGRGGEMLFHGAVGLRQQSPAPEAATTDTLYDLASLTKVISTTTAVMLLREEGKLDLDQKVSEYLPLPGLDRFTLRHCITHTTGLPPFKVWYREIAGAENMVRRIAELGLDAPPGTRRVYSDLGFILLGQCAAQAAREPLDAFVKRRVFAPLKMERTTFRPDAALRAECAPTEQCPWRGRMVRGEVHDENAFAMGGVSGHAGLFSTAGDLAIFCRALLGGRIVKPATLDEMLRPGQVPGYAWQGLGWWLDPWMSGANGYLPSRTAFGHTGWTGTALWIDRETEIFTILLSNTCHPTRARRDNTSLRKTFFDGAALPLYPDRTNAHTALDYLVRDDFSGLKGKGLGVLTNNAATDQTGRPAAEVLRQEPGLRLTRYFSPEHGLRLQAEAGAAVAGDNVNGVPVVSLYGDKKGPSPEDLRGVDLFVADLPDVGARYYTYLATLLECMTACAAAGVPVKVLDRPNPLGGVVLEGAVAIVADSPVCRAPVPARHGMTLGEAAMFLQQTRPELKKLDLSVQPAENWRRELMHHQCALPWSPPSPNLPTADAALAYAGTCLFEGVNLNEGRGTETPFLLFGAPWVDNLSVAEMIAPEDSPGMRLVTALYTPKSLPGRAADPAFRDKVCKGFRVEFTDRTAARPFRLAVALLCALHRRHKDRLEWKPFFDTLAGGPDLRELIQRGASAADITAVAEPGLAAFDAARPKLYSTTTELLDGYEKLAAARPLSGKPGAPAS